MPDYDLQCGMISVCIRESNAPLSPRASMQGIVEGLLQRGIAEHSEGAVCISVEVSVIVPHLLTCCFLPVRANMEATTGNRSVMCALRWDSEQRAG